MAASGKVTDLRLQQAIRSWTLRQSGAWTRDDEANLEIWLAADPENRAAYEKVGRAWVVTGQAAGRVAREMPTRRPYGLWIAASLLAALSYPLWVMSDNWWNGPRAEWSAERGQTRKGCRLRRSGGHDILPSTCRRDGPSSTRSRFAAWYPGRNDG